MERAAEAARRETQEETGLVIGEVRFLGVDERVFENDQHHWISLLYATEDFTGEARIMEPEKHTAALNGSRLMRFLISFRSLRRRRSAFLINGCASLPQTPDVPIAPSGRDHPRHHREQTNRAWPRSLPSLRS